MDHRADHPHEHLAAPGAVLVAGAGPQPDLAAGPEPGFAVGPPAGFTVGPEPGSAGSRPNLAARIGARLPRWTSPALVLACFAGGAAYALGTNPTDSPASASPTCLVRLTTGFDCPGCGGTRAFWYLLHGDLPAAARSHLFAVFAAPFLVYLYLTWAVKVVTGRQLPQLQISASAVAIFVAAWGVWAVLRNLPWAPFTWFFV